MAMNFPSSPTVGQVFVPPAGAAYVWRTDHWARYAGRASRVNKIVNPAFQISQQNGDTVLSGSSAGSYYLADQWLISADTTVTYQRVTLPTPRGSKYRLRMTIASINAGKSLNWQQDIEGNRIIDLNYGTANAAQSVLRFGVRGPAGTYSIGIRGYLNQASYVMPFTIQNMVDTEFSFVVPPCTGLGTWATSNAIGARITITASTAAGTSTPNVWSANNEASLSGQTNIGSVAGQTFDIFDVGWYLDPYNTGVAPEFQSPHVEDDLLDCLRYWYPCYRFDGVVNTTSQGIGWASHHVAMRVAPTFSVVGSIRTHDISVAPNVSSVTSYQNSPESTALSINQAGATYTLGRPFRTLVDAQVANYIALNARMT